MALEHITQRSVDGWLPVTAKEAKKQNPSTIPAKTGFYRCETCGQNVAFVVGIKGAHFKHPKGSKECSEKIIAFRKTNALGFSLPLKIEFDEDQLFLSIGFPALTEEQLIRAIQDHVTITVSGNGEIFRTFQIDSDRFSTQNMKYREIGNTFCEEYSLAYVSNDESLKKLLPLTVKGINKDGSLFDCGNHKRLSEMGEVLVGKKYLLIQQNHYLKYDNDIEVQRVQTLSNSWNAYFITALKRTPRTEDFFYQYKTLLVDIPSELIPIWPPCVCYDQLIRYQQAPIFFLHCGNGFIEWLDKAVEFSQTERNTTIYQINNPLEQNILSLSRRSRHSTVFQYLFLNKASQTVPPATPSNACFFDMAGCELEKRIYHQLPPNRSIQVIIPFDGFIKVSRAEVAKNVVPLTSATPTFIDVQWGDCIQVFQGLDLLTELRFIRSQPSNSVSDQTLLENLVTYARHPIPATHELGHIATRLKEYPKVKRWLLGRIRQGIIDQRALQHLKQSMGGIHHG